ncbi:MAG: 16S rRNA (adenine(1518)-N(6)/adenine(1519)-N(6))-dimethyltransferase RsmA [Chloroflexota bacterium]
MPGTTTITRVKQLLRSRNLRANKRLGQHFLVDTGIHKSIAAAANLSTDDTVIEIGPGTGLLTGILQPLVAEVIAVEIDRGMVELLQETLEDVSNVSIVEADVLAVNPGTLLMQNSRRNATSYKVVANLPYYITSPVIRHFLTADVQPDLMIVMVQEEVARSITARPGDMSLLSVSVQLLARASVVRRVPARAFYPQPKVDSMVVRLKAIPQLPIPASDVSKFVEFVAAGFRSPRKHIRNSLAKGLDAPRDYVESLLAGAGIEPARRPETLSVEDWVGLWQLYGQQGEPPAC